MNTPSPTSTLDRFQPWIIGAALFCVYAALAQANLTYDGAAFITWYVDRGMPHPQHPIFGYWLNLCLKLGRASGLTLVQAGLLQSALTAAAAAGLYYKWLRRLAIGSLTAFLFTLMLGLAGTVIEIATTVELYGIALLAVAISLHAWLSEVRKPSVTGAIALFLSCLLIVFLHVGWSLWVLALYLALAWHERTHRTADGISVRSSNFSLPVILRLSQGASVAIALALWFILGSQFGGLSLHYQKTFYSAYIPSGGVNLLKPFSTVFIGFIANGGLLLFPSIAAAIRYRRAHSDLFALFMLATIVFFVGFGFWPPDRGEFYLPVLALWGFFAARMAEDFSRDAHSAWIFSMAAFAYAAAILASIWTKEPGLLAFMFWIYAAASAGWGWVHPDDAQADAATRPRPVLYIFFLILTLVLYLPPAIQQLKPSVETTRLNLFGSIAPSDARLVTSLSPFIASAQTGHATQAPLADSFSFNIHNTRKFLASWIEDLRAGGSSIWFDADSWKNRDKIFNFPGEKPIAWKDLNVTPRRANGEVFYEMKSANPKNANQ